jgi:hypothetical protein
MKKLLLLLLLIPNLVMADDFDKRNGLSCFSLNHNGQLSNINCDTELTKESRDCLVSSPKSSPTSAGGWTKIDTSGDPCWKEIDTSGDPGWG